MLYSVFEIIFKDTVSAVTSFFPCVLRCLVLDFLDIDNRCSCCPHAGILPEHHPPFNGSPVPAVLHSYDVQWPTFR